MLRTLEMVNFSSRFRDWLPGWLRGPLSFLFNERAPEPSKMKENQEEEMPEMPIPPNLLMPIAPPFVAPKYSPNFTPISRTRKIDLIVLHATVGAFDGAVAWLCQKDRPNPTSAHYVISKKADIVQLVADNDVAWHAGLASWKGQGMVNMRSIGIELENGNTGKYRYPDEQLAACLWLVLRICKAHGIASEDIVGHADVAPGRKTDPAGFPWAEFRASAYYHLNSKSGEILCKV